MNTTSKAGIKYSSILLVFFLFLLFPAYFFIYPGSGPAASGDIALHLARQYGFVFGKDIDSLYGPLGILRSRLPIAVSLTFYLLFDAYFLVTAFMVIRNILREHFHYGVIVFIFLAISINMTAALNDWFFFFLLFYVFSFLRTPEKSGYLLQGSILAVIGLYFRLDTGLFGALLFLAVVTYSLIRKKLTLGGFCRWILFFLVAVLVAGWILHVNLPGYIGTGIHLLSDYGEARFQAGPEKGKLLFHLAMEMMVCLFYWIGCLVILAVTRRDGKKADEIFVCLAVMAAAFIYFKSCFVRADDGQVFRFFAIMSLLIAFFYLNGPEDVWRRVPILGCWIVLGLSTLAVNLDKSQSKPPVLRLIDLSFIPGRFRAIGTYFSGIWRYRS
ncbi:MAG TPA: hypothetical protein VG605_07865, partial [Puia sp.]|nr:hypothetical protein [Puia sp.]